MVNVIGVRAFSRVRIMELRSVSLVTNLKEAMRTSADGGRGFDDEVSRAEILAGILNYRVSRSK